MRTDILELVSFKFNNCATFYQFVLIKNTSFTLKKEQRIRTLADVI